MNVLDIQRRLIAAGFSCGPSGADGIWGRGTLAAVKAFQKARGLNIKWPGTVGPLTIEALNAVPMKASDDPAKIIPPSVASQPVWLTQAAKWIGLTEIPGSKSNAQILAWGKAAETWYTNDDTPWCGAFVDGVLARALPDEALPTHPLYALNWREFGVALQGPALGAVVVFSRTGGGHVGFYVGETTSEWVVLGGNQSNQVRVSKFVKKGSLKLQAFRWPASVALPKIGALAFEGEASLTTQVV